MASTDVLKQISAALVCSHTATSEGSVACCPSSEACIRPTAAEAPANDL